MVSLASLVPILRATPVTSSLGAFAAMQAIEAALAPAGQPADGVGWFNRLYMAVTESVAKPGTSAFEHPEYIEQLDVAFANLYFSALSAFLANVPEVPRAWWPLLVGRERSDVAPIQFAFAGMNAHINRDLPVALASLWRDPNAHLPSREAQQADYTRVNQLLTSIETEVKGWFLNGKWQQVDAAFHGVDDVVASFSIAEARQGAWVQAEALAALGAVSSSLQARYLEALDGVVGLAGRGLLVRTRF
jgi:Family of unknown function (DUF5995)